MHPGLAASVIAILFASATLFADRLPEKRRWIPVTLLALVLGFCFFELARHDHGHTRVLSLMGWIVAPLVLIFGGASWGTRRFYGWPDFGPHPSRAAVVALGILLGVLWGSNAQLQDLRASQRTAETLREQILAFRSANADQWPASLGLVADPVPTTSMGMLAPPPFRYGRDVQGKTVLAIPLGGTGHMQLDLDAGVWERRPRAPRSLTPAESTGE